MTERITLGTAAPGPIDVAVFLPSMSGGGAQRVFSLLTGEFARQGIAVEVVLAEGSGPYLKDIPEAVPVEILGSTRVRASLVPLIRYLRNRRPRTLLVTMTEANLVALVARALSRTRVRTVVREINTLGAIQHGLLDLRARLMPGLVRYFYGSADAVIAPSEGLARDLAKLTRIPLERIHIIPNPATPPYATGKVPSWFTRGKSPVILGMGRLTAQKDFSTLLRAVALIRVDRPIRAIILGEGKDRAALQQLITELHLGDDVWLPGFVPNPGDFLQQATVFVLSSAWEGMPNALLQALAVGCPSVSTACPSGPDEILDRGRVGPLVPIGDSRAMASAICLMLDHPTPRETLLARAADYALPTIAKQYLEVLLPESNPAQ